MNLRDAKSDKNAPAYTRTAFAWYPVSSKILASKLSQIAAPKKATEEISSPVDFFRFFVHFLGESRTPYIAFEIYWPLANKKII